MLQVLRRNIPWAIQKGGRPKACVGAVSDALRGPAAFAPLLGLANELMIYLVRHVLN